MMAFFKIVGLLLSMCVIQCGAQVETISDNAAFIGVSIMLAGFMAGGSNK